MVSVQGIKFQLKRINSTLRGMLKNKMAVIGLFLIASFVFVALAAPLLTPYGPKDHVSGEYAQPEWVMNFPEGYYLSRNVVAVNAPLFNSPSDVQQLAVVASSDVLSSLQVSYAPGVSPRIDSKGSVQLSYSGTVPGKVQLTHSFYYPYRGAPKNFKAEIQYLLPGLTSAPPIHVRLFITTPAGQVFTIYEEDDGIANTQWLPSSLDLLDTLSPSLGDRLNLGGSGFKAQDVIFSAIGTYTYGVEYSFKGPQKVYVDDFQLSLYGSAWGLFGTDNGGADVYTQTIYGAQVSLLVGLLSAGIGISLGLIIGLLAGFLGKVVDEVLMRFTDMLLVIPGLPLLIVLVAVLGPNIWNLIIVIGFLGWMGFARIVRSQVLTLRERPFIEAARASGAGPGRIIAKHIFPNIVSLTYVNLALTVPGAILAEAALSFLGLGDPAVTSWGNMFFRVSQAGALSRHPPPWWWVLPPGFGIALVSLSFVLIGYALDEIFNPRLRRRR